MRFIRGRLSSAHALYLVYGQPNGESSIEEMPYRRVFGPLAKVKEKIVKVGNFVSVCPNTIEMILRMYQNLIPDD